VAARERLLCRSAGQGAEADKGAGVGPQDAHGRDAYTIALQSTSKDGRFGEGKEKMTWHGETRELGRRIGKLLEQIVFWG
jgi:hypothetical protein